MSQDTRSSLFIAALIVAYLIAVIMAEHGFRSPQYYVGEQESGIYYVWRNVPCGRDTKYTFASTEQLAIEIAEELNLWRGKNRRKQ